MNDSLDDQAHRTAPSGVRSNRSGAKIHRSAKNPSAPAEYAGDTVCGRWARDMIDAGPVTETDPTARCTNCWKGTDWPAGGQAPVVSGHGLIMEGSPFGEKGSRVSGSTGRGKCRCGELSESLTSTSARRRWHRDHKRQLLEAQGA